MATVRLSDIRVYIEGIHIPVNSVLINASANAPSTCSIIVPPVIEWTRLPPRSYVQIFFRDYFEDSHAVFERRYKLLWDGEFRRFSLSRGVGQWDVQLDCEDATNYWSQSWGLFAPGTAEGLDQVEIGASGTDTTKVSYIRSSDTVLSHRQKDILLGLGPNQRDEKTGRSRIERVALDYFTEAMLLNPFYRRQNQKYKLTPLTTREEEFGEVTVTDPRTRVMSLEDPEVSVLFKAFAMEDLIDHAVGEVSNALDLRTVITRFLELFFYLSYPVIAPPFHWGEAGVVNRGDDPLPENLEAIRNTKLVQMVLKPTTYFSAPPACNVIWPDDVQSISYSQDHFSEPTRLRLTSMPQTSTDVPQASYLAQSLLRYNYQIYAPPLLGDVLELAIIAQAEAAKEQSGLTRYFLSGIVTPSTDPSVLAKQIISNIQSSGTAENTVLDEGLLEEVLRTTLYQNNALASALVLSDPRLPPESREDIKGVIPSDLPLTSWAWTAFYERAGEAQTVSGVRISQSALYIRRAADYYLALRQHERHTQVSMPFNPYLLLGFPAVVLDHVFPVFGEVASLSHSITATQSQTNIVLNYSRLGDAVRYVDDGVSSGGAISVNDFYRMLRTAGGSVLATPTTDELRSLARLAGIKDPTSADVEELRDLVRRVKLPETYRGISLPDQGIIIDQPAIEAFLNKGDRSGGTASSDYDQATGTPLENENVTSQFTRKEPNRDVPFWINASYRPEFAGREEFRFLEPTDTNNDGILNEAKYTFREGAYQKLFGIGSMFQDWFYDPDAGGKLVDPRTDLQYSQLECAKLLLRIRESKKSADARQRFADRMRNRRVASMEEVLVFLDAVLINQTELANSSWRTDPTGGDEATAAVVGPYSPSTRETVREIRKSVLAQARDGGI